MCSASCVRRHRGTVRIRTPLLLSAGRAAIDISCPPGPQRVCCCWPMLGQTDGHHTVTQTLLRILCGHRTVPINRDAILFGGQNFGFCRVFGLVYLSTATETSCDAKCDLHRCWRRVCLPASIEPRAISWLGRTSPK